MSNTLTKLRYRYWPDHVFGELLQKQWMETAVPLLVLLLTIAFFSSRIDNFISVANLSDTLRQASELGFVVLGMSLVLIVGGIDLSVASIFALCNLTALYHNMVDRAFGEAAAHRQPRVTGADHNGGYIANTSQVF